MIVIYKRIVLQERITIRLYNNAQKKQQLIIDKI